MRASARTRGLLGSGLLLLACALYLPFALHDGLPSAPHSDANFATQNARGFIDGLEEGQWLPRWHAEVNRGYGAPTFLFYSPGAYYAVAAVHGVVPDLLTALRLTGLLLAVGSGISFAWAARRWVPPAAATVGAACYVALPYHVLDLYERFALGETAAFLWFPLLFAFSDRLLDGKSPRAWLGLSIRKPLTRCVRTRPA